MKPWFYIFIIWSLLAFACDPCNDCGDTLAYEPTVNMKFINQDSLDILNSVIEQNNIQIAELAESIAQVKAELTELKKELAQVEADIEEGNTDLGPTKQDLLDRIEEKNEILNTLEEQDNALDASNKNLNAKINTIESGMVLVNNITFSNGQSISYEDSTTDYVLPLLMKSEEGPAQTDYKVIIHTDTFRFSLVYQLNHTVDDARIFKIVASDISYLDNYTCDTLIIDCTNCISNETNISVYF